MSRDLEEFQEVYHLHVIWVTSPRQDIRIK
jgi:hypothetical protein